MTLNKGTGTEECVMSTWHQTIQEDDVLVQGGFGGFSISGGCWPVRFCPCVAFRSGHHIHGVEC